MKLVLLEEAQQQFEGEDAWWRDNRDAKDLFLEEFSAVLGQISSMPEVGQRYRRTRGRLIQRMLMKKTRCHVYYFHDQGRRRRRARQRAPRANECPANRAGRGRSPLGLGCSPKARPEAVDIFSLVALEEGS